MIEILKEDKNETLNTDLWENNELRPEVREKLLEIVDRFKNNLKENDIDLEVNDVLILGSNASYNYNEHSDIDLHVISDVSKYSDDVEGFVEKLYNAYKSLWNQKYDPTIRGHEVELYVEPWTPEKDKDDNGVPDKVEDKENIMPITKGDVI